MWMKSSNCCNKYVTVRHCSSHTTTANSMVDWTPARLLLALQQLYKKVKFSPKFPWLSSHFFAFSLTFPDHSNSLTFSSFPWPVGTLLLSLLTNKDSYNWQIIRYVNNTIFRKRFRVPGFGTGSGTLEPVLWNRFLRQITIFDAWTQKCWSGLFHLHCWGSKLKILFILIFYLSGWQQKGNKL